MLTLFSRHSRSSSRKRNETPSDVHATGSAQASSSSVPEALDPRGLSLLSSPEGNATLVDIIAVYGLDGHSRKTWTSDNGCLWLKDFLPVELPNSAATVTDFALGLLDELDNARTRPEAIILVLEQMHRYGDLLSSVRGLVFLGTPHKGAQLANWTRYSRDIIDIAPLGPSVVRRTLLRDLETNSDLLKKISDSFQHRALTIKITSFYERIFTMPVKRLVVDKDSAILGYPGEEALPIDADHRDICKIRTRDSQQWRSLIGAVKRQLSDLDLETKYAEAQALGSNSLVNIPSEIEERINPVLNPVNFSDEVEQRIDFEMCPDTGSWVLENNEYLKWRREKACGILWIHGSPGNGKSFLTSFMLKNLSIGSSLGHTGVAYFACDRVVRTQPRSAALVLYNSIIVQLLLQLVGHDEGAVGRILTGFEASQAVGQFSTPFSSWKNLKSSTSLFKSCFILIDGLDENKEWQDVLALLKRLVRESQGSIRLLISSRSWDTIRELIYGERQDTAAVIQLNKELMTSDLKSFVAWKIKDLDTRDLGGHQKVLERLIMGAYGLMLLAKYRTETLLRQTKRGNTDLDQILKSLPKEVNDYYTQSISRIKDLPSQEREIVVQIFTWVTFAARILTFQELSEVISFHHTKRPVPTSATSATITRSSIDRLCQGLVVLQKDTVGVSHGSVFRYLREEGLPSITDLYTGPIESLDRNIVEAELAGALLNYLCLCPSPDLENGKTWSTATLREYPLLDYSLNCWSYHAFGAKKIIPAAFEKFLKFPQHLHWWQCWSQGVDARGGITSYNTLQYMFHGWLDSFRAGKAKEIIRTAGPVLPLRMLEEKLAMLEAHPRGNREHLLHTLNVLSALYIEYNRFQAGLEAGERVAKMESQLTNRSRMAHGTLARVYGMRGDRVKEAEMKEQLLNFARSQHGIHHAQKTIALDNLALGYSRLGQHKVADELSLEALQLANDLFGEDHPETVQVTGNRAMILLDAGRLEEAQPLAATASQMISLIRSKGHRLAIVAKDNLAQILYDLGNDIEARKLRLESLSLAMVSLGHDHPTTKTIFSALEEEFGTKEDLEALAALRRHKMLLYVEIYGEEDPRTLEMMNRMFLVYFNCRDWESARTIGERLVNGLRPQKDDIDEGRLWQVAIQKLSKVYDFSGDYQKGISLGEETLQLYLQKNELQNEFGLAAARDLSRMYYRLKDWGNAIRCGSLAVEIATNTKGKDSNEAITFNRELALAFWSAKRPQAGFTLDWEVLDTCSRVYGAVHPTTIDALLTVCEAMIPCKQKHLVLHYYELLLLTQKMSNEIHGANHPKSADIQFMLDQLFCRVSEEWHPDMLALQTKYHSTDSDSLNTQDPSSPINETRLANLAIASGNATGTESQGSGRTNPGPSSAAHEVVIAYFNAKTHHFDLQAMSFPAEEIEGEGIGGGGIKEKGRIMEIGDEG